MNGTGTVIPVSVIQDSGSDSVSGSSPSGTVYGLDMLLQSRRSLSRYPSTDFQRAYNTLRVPSRRTANRDTNYISEENPTKLNNSASAPAAPPGADSQISWHLIRRKYCPNLFIRA